MNASHSIRELLAQGLAHHQSNRLAEAAGYYRQVLDQDPGHYDALHLLGVLLRQQGELEPALNLLHHAIQRRPDLAKTHQELGVVLLGLKRFEESVAAFEHAVRLEPQVARGYEFLGHAYQAYSYVEEAIANYRKALAISPQGGSSRENLRIVCERARNLAAFAEQCRRFLDKPSEAFWPPQGKLETRNLFPHLLSQLGLLGTGVEIGVQRGDYSEHLLRHWKGRLLYSVDCWREFSSGQYVDAANVPQSQHDQNYVETIRRLMPFKDRSIIWRLTSNEAADLISDGSLDFCYIDADHSYEGVRADISLWFPKVKAGGVLGGHDYILDGTHSFGVFGVRRAVNEFVAKEVVEFFTSGEPEFELPSWFILKRK